MMYIRFAYDMDLRPQLSCALIASIICRITVPPRSQGRAGAHPRSRMRHPCVGEETSLGAVSEVDMW